MNEQEQSKQNPTETNPENVVLTDSPKRGSGILLPIGITIVVVVVVVAFFVSQTDSLTREGDYIGGNTISMPSTGYWDGDREVVPSPWKNMNFASILMHRALFLADSSFETTSPDLANSLIISSDSMTYTIEMKDGIKWSDGEPLTVDDVVFSLEQVFFAEEVNGIYIAAFSQIQGADDYQKDPSIGISGLSVEENTITIQLIAPYPAMEQVLAQFTIVPKHILEALDMISINDNLEYWKNPVVCGMYKMGEIVLGETVQLIKNEYYEGISPQIEEIVFKTDYLKSIDYFSTNNIEEIMNLRAMKGMQEYQVDVLFYRYFIFNMIGVDGVENEAMQDIRVRKALGYAIDRETLIHNVYLGTGAIIDSGVPASHSAYVGADTSIEYDPEKAKELLEEARYDFERPIRLTYYYMDDISKTFMEGVARNFEAIGLTVELFKIEAGSELYNEREYDLGLKGLSAFSLLEWYAEYDDDNPNFRNIFGGETEFEPLLNDLSATVDIKEIDVILRELQYLEVEHYFKLPLFTLNHSVFINTNRINIPEDVVFANTYYRYDVNFEEWSVKKE